MPVPRSSAPAGPESCVNRLALLLERFFPEPAATPLSASPRGRLRPASPSAIPAASSPATSPLFNESLVAALHVVELIVSSPESLAELLEAAGSLALERAGAILDQRFPEE